MKLTPVYALALVMVTTSSLAAPADKKADDNSKPAAAAAKPVKPKSGKPDGSSGGSVDIKDGIDIIGSQDAPLELNIVPWKDKENVLPKNPLEASMLKEVLEPIDRDVLRREVDFSRALQSQPTTSP